MDTIKYIDRTTKQIKEENVPGEGMLKWLYNSGTGKIALHLLFKRKVISALGGWFMNSKLSTGRISKFVKEHQINMEECLISDLSEYDTFNKFFYRKLKDGARPLGKNVVSPADGKVLAFQTLNEISSFFIKGSEFTLSSFLKNEKLAKKYKDGAMLIFRLAPADYHRFHFPSTGKISKSIKIDGSYFSVSPLALMGSLRIFCENLREYSILETGEYGDILISDVGATMVGSIVQTYEAETVVNKGDEKGYFAFGGSTLVLLFEKGRIKLSEDLCANTQRGLETYIRMGEDVAF